MIRLIEEIYSFKMDEKSVNQSGCSASVKAMPNDNLQQASAKYLFVKFKAKLKADQVAMDFMISLEYHKETSVECDLFYRFFTSQYSDQDLTFFLFVRSLAERELRMKFAMM